MFNQIDPKINKLGITCHCFSPSLKGILLIKYTFKNV